MNIEDRQLRIEHFTGSEVVKPEPDWISFKEQTPPEDFSFYTSIDGVVVGKYCVDMEEYRNFIDALPKTHSIVRAKFWCDKSKFDEAFSEYQYLKKRYEGWGKVEEENEVAFLKGEYVLTFHEWGISIWHPKTINLSSEKISIRTFESILKDHGI